MGAFGVNFRSLQEIEAIMGGGQIFDTGRFFARLRYKHILCAYISTKALASG